MSNGVQKPSELGISMDGRSVDSLPPGHWKCLCPACSKRRRHASDPCLSLTVKPDGDWVVNCHNCGWSAGRGGETHRSRFTYSRPDYTPTDPQKQLLDYFAKRGISADIVRRNKISLVQTWMPDSEGKVPAIAFPYYKDGELVNVKYRTFDKRFRQEKNAEKVFYGIDDLEGDSFAIIVEGEFDKLTFEAAGFKNVISVPDGAMAQPLSSDSKKMEYLPNCEDQLSKMQRFLIATDNDDPGNVLAEELARRLGREKCFRVRFPQGYKDANALLTGDALLGLPSLGVDAALDAVESAEPWPVEGIRRASQYTDQIITRFREGRKRGLTTGISQVDELFTMVPGRLYVVSGFPSSGKSEVIDQLAVNAAINHSWTIGMWSAENEPDEHIPKLIEKYIGMPFWDGLNTRMDEADIDNGLGWVNRHFVFLGDDRVDVNQTIEWILNKAKSAVLSDGINMLVVDPVNYIEIDNGMEPDTNFYKRILIKLSRFAKMYGVAVFLVAHPAKPPPDARDKPPTAYSISGSAAYYNVADILFIVHRDKTKKSRLVDIICHKVRFKWIGDIGKTTLDYNRATGCYMNGPPPTPPEYED